MVSAGLRARRAACESLKCATKARRRTVAFLVVARSVLCLCGRAVVECWDVDVLRLLAEQAETLWDLLLPVEAFRAGPDRP
jgi:hypothetical protein